MPPAGRGGAGNYEQRERVKQASSQQDLEAQISDSSSATAAHETLPLQRDTQPYAHTGRGGAGNWYSPDTLSQTGTFSTESAKPIAGSSGSTTSGGAFSGRGGAGNLREAPPTVITNNDPVETELKVRAEKAVEAEVPKPEQAHSGGREIVGKSALIDISF